MVGLFDKIKIDVKKGIEEGIAAVKEGASVVSGKVVEFTAEGKRQYKMYDLKAKIQTQMTVLGGRVYDVLESKKSPTADSKVNSVYVKIRNLEAQLSKLEKGNEKKTTAPKKPARKGKVTSPKTGPAVAKKRATKAAVKLPAKK